jgi:hypothetical protein
MQKRGRRGGLQLSGILVIAQRRGWENRAIDKMERFFDEKQFYQLDQMNGKRSNGAIR